jgi:hypothetical protein
LLEEEVVVEVMLEVEQELVEFYVLLLFLYVDLFQLLLVVAEQHNLVVHVVLKAQIQL